MKKMVIVFGLYWLTSANMCFTQSNFDINYKNPQIILPQVAEIMKFVDYQPNLYNGLIDITIPLYEIRAGDLVLPISISYHASGLRTSETSGKISLGWTLNAEPSVSRKINGKADERAYLSSDEFPTYKPLSNDDPYLFYKGAMEDRYDLEPDAFYYKLANKSGRFFYKKHIPAENNPNNEIITVPYDPIKISGDPSPFSSYTITDDNGVQYSFSHGYGYGGICEVDTRTTQWLASKMTSANNKDSIVFTYTPLFHEDNYMSSNESHYMVVEEQIAWWLTGTSARGFTGCDYLHWPFLLEFYNNVPIDGVYNIVPDSTNLVGWPDTSGTILYSGEKQQITGSCDKLGQYENPAPHIIWSQNIETIHSQYAEIIFFLRSAIAKQRIANTDRSKG
jgi:hypothetical protein